MSVYASVVFLGVRTDSGKLRAHMYNHDDCHYQSQDVREVVGRLEDECVGELDSS